MVTGKTTKDSEALYALNVTCMDARERYAPLIIPIDALEAKLKEQSSPMWGFGIGGAILSAFGVFASWKAMKWKKPDEEDGVIKLKIVELTQDEQDRRELAQLREKDPKIQEEAQTSRARIQLLEARLAPQSYRDPDRTVTPTVPQRVDPLEEPDFVESDAVGRLEPNGRKHC
jgi:hypothetical protein